MKIKTERLEIRPLSSEQLSTYATNPGGLQRSLKLEIEMEPLSEHMKKVFALKASRIEQFPESLLYHTYYLIIADYPRRLVGQIGLRGEPDEDGLVEVGYHIIEAEQNQGYMKEALSGYVAWLMKFREISGVNACTSRDNYKSQSVLIACDFEQVYSQGDLLVWQYTSL